MLIQPIPRHMGSCQRDKCLQSARKGLDLWRRRCAGGISDPLYNGFNLATDSMVVSILYRIGAMGFLALETGGITGNFGVQDILLGLEWVQQNIAAFGGDPECIPMASSALFQS
jgi:Carboxylesterase family